MQEPIVEHRLTKRFRLVWDDKKQIIMKGESVIWTAQNCFESDTEAEINAKVRELNLVEVDEIVELPER